MWELMGTSPLVRMVVRAVAPLAVLAAGGIADGAGLAAALALGAEGVLLGTRFLATAESPLPDMYKQAIVASDGHDSLVTEIPDVATGTVWPGACARTYRNQSVQRWIGREGDWRAQRRTVSASLQQARAAGDVDRGALLFGQDAGLIDSIEPAGLVVERMVSEPERMLRERLSDLLVNQIRAPGQRIVEQCRLRRWAFRALSVTSNVSARVGDRPGTATLRLLVFPSSSVTTRRRRSCAWQHTQPAPVLRQARPRPHVRQSVISHQAHAADERGQDHQHG